MSDMGTQLGSVPGTSAAFEGGDCLPLSLNLDWKPELCLNPWKQYADAAAHPPGRQSIQVFLPIADQTMSLWHVPPAVCLLSAPKGRPGQGDFKEGNLVTSSPTWLKTEFTQKGFFFFFLNKIYIPIFNFSFKYSRRRPRSWNLFLESSPGDPAAKARNQ